MASIELIVRAGNHARRQTPVQLPFDEGVAGRGRLQRQDSGKALPCQWLDGTVHFVLDGLNEADECRLSYDPDGQPPRSAGVRLRHDEAAHSVTVDVGGRLFTVYRFAPDCARPHFYPFLDASGTQMIRQYPMRENVAGETSDHKHHRGVWVALGDVNGTDNWTEEDGHAWQTHRGLSGIAQGPVFGTFTQTLAWEDSARRQVCLEQRTVRVFRTAGVRILELKTQLTAGEQGLRIGDTKEGGVCSVRVPTSMDGTNGGVIQNSVGGIGESETWGKPAHWCDYSGMVEGRRLGIAIFDHTMNLRHPTPWHVRDYGLMTANPFGHGDYSSSLLTDGSHTVAAGSTLTFRYRIYVHAGDARLGRVADRYHDYVNPPEVERA